MAEMIRRILRMKQVVDKTGLCRTSLIEKIKKREFPAPFSIGAGRARGFLESDVDEWIDQCVKRAAAPLTTTLEQPTAPAKLKQSCSAKAKTADQLDPAETRRLEKKQAKAATESA